MEYLVVPTKWKRKHINTHLTLSKKCRRYRNKKNQQTQLSLEDFSSGTDTEWEMEKEETNGYLHPQNSTHNITNEQVPLKPICKVTNTQTYFSTKNISIQNVPLSRSRRNQTNPICVKQVQRSTQTTDLLFKTSETQKLLDKLKVDDAFDKFVSILNEHEQIDKFVKIVKVIASGELAATNLCWKATLDMGALFSCKSTTQMDYDKEWLEFCQVIYHMFGGGVINAL